MNIYIMVYILEMLYAGFSDRNFSYSNTKALHQAHCVAVGSVSCSESRHGYCYYIFSVDIEYIKCLCCNK